MKRLTPKQDAFALAYFETGNASEAYRRAYNVQTKSERTVWRSAHALLNHPKVAARIDRLRAEASREVEITAQDVMREAWKIATTAKSESARVAALSLLAKRFREFSEKSEDVTRDARIDYVQRALACSRDEAERAVAEAERLVGSR